MIAAGKTEPACKNVAAQSSHREFLGVATWCRVSTLVASGVSADDVVPVASSGRDLQLALRQYLGERGVWGYRQAGTCSDVDAVHRWKGEAANLLIRPCPHLQP